VAVAAVAMVTKVLLVALVVLEQMDQAAVVEGVLHQMVVLVMEQLEGQVVLIHFTQAALAEQVQEETNLGQAEAEAERES
jgi:hypothetical protein